MIPLLVINMNARIRKSEVAEGGRQQHLIKAQSKAEVDAAPQLQASRTQHGKRLQTWEGDAQINRRGVQGDGQSTGRNGERRRANYYAHRGRSALQLQGYGTLAHLSTSKL